MIQNKSKIIIGIAACAAATILTVLTLGTQILAGNAPAPAPEIEFDRDALQQRRQVASTVAMSHPQVKETLDNSASYVIDYHWLDNDRVTIATWGSVNVSPVDGSFTNGYNEEYEGGKITEVEIDRRNNAIIDIQVTPVQDKTITVKFTDNQKRAVEISLADARVKELLAGKQYYIDLVRDYGNVQISTDPEVEVTEKCGFNECAIVQFTSLSGHGGMGTIVNTKTGVVHDITVGSGWR